MTVQRDGPVVTLVLSRPERRNPLSHETMAELTERLREAGDDPSVRAVVLGAQGTAFCAGHDMHELATRDAAVHERVFAACAELMLTIHGLRQPVIARVQGIATAAGCQLVAACDLAVAAEGARFGAPGSRSASSARPRWWSWRVVGRTRAMEMLLTGEPIDARTALGWGLVNRVVALGHLDDEAVALAGRVASASGETLAIGKRAARQNLGLPAGGGLPPRQRRHVPQRRHRRRPGGHRGLPGEATAGLEPVTPQPPTRPPTSRRCATTWASWRRSLEQVERAIAGWEDSTPRSPVVAEGDREIDLRSSALEARILSLHQNWSTFASDLRLLHVGLIAAVALERVGNLAVSIARLAGSAPPPEAGAEAVRRLIARMGETAIDALALAVQAVARSDLEAGAQAVRDAARLSPMLDQVLAAVAQAPGEPGMRAWSAAAVVARHVERVANNAAELGARVHFLVTGLAPSATRSDRPRPAGGPPGRERPALGARRRRPAPTWWRPTSTCGAAGWSCATRAGSARCSGTARASPWSAARLRGRSRPSPPSGRPPSRSST